MTESGAPGVGAIPEETTSRGWHISGLDMKTVYIEPAWKLPLSYQAMLANPPVGYHLFTDKGITDSTLWFMSSLKFPYRVQSALNRYGIPVHLMKAYLGRLKRLPARTDLTLAATHVVFRKEPWILDLTTEMPAILVGSEWHFHRYKGVVKRLLLSPCCKKVITSIQVGKRALVKSVDGEESEEQKIEVVDSAVPRKEFAKSFDDRRVKLLFVSSANIPGQFDLKGGKETLEVFVALRRRYANVELVVRSDIPPVIRRRFAGIPGLKLLEKVLPWQALEREFQTADIFLLPAHHTPNMAFIDAMSYELPVVTLDVWASAELVEDGKTGCIVPKSRLAPEFEPSAPWRHSRHFDKVMKQVDPRVVETLTHELSILIENPELRRRMGRAARWEVEHGRFSIERRNERLKRIFDEATA